MGNFVSNVFRRSMKPIKNYNLDSRVDKVLERQKPIVAPKFPEDEVKINEDIKNQLQDSDTELLKRLQQVYVTSQNTNQTFQSKRPLPTSRTQIPEYEYGYRTPKITKYGKSSLSDILYFISKHQESPSEWTPKRIAEEYKLDLGQTEKLLKYFCTFHVVLPITEEKVDESRKEQWDDWQKSLGAQRLDLLEAFGPKKNEPSITPIRDPGLSDPVSDEHSNTGNRSSTSQKSDLTSSNKDNQKGGPS